MKRSAKGVTRMRRIVLVLAVTGALGLAGAEGVEGATVSTAPAARVAPSALGYTYREACSQYTGKCVVEVCFHWPGTDPRCTQHVEYRHTQGGWALVPVWEESRLA